MSIIKIMKFYGELLVFFLLMLTNLRVFFVRHARRDPLVSLAPFTLLISVLQIIAWGVEVFTLLAFIISILVFLSNFHAIFRYSERLYIDHYSPLMKIWAIFTIAISIAAISAIIIFAPVETKSEKINVTETTTRYTGNFRTGFERATSFSKSNLFLYKFSPAQVSGSYVQNKGLILFVPDKRADSANYKPYLQTLAKEGYTVYSADFYADDGRWLHSWQDMRIFRRISMVVQSIMNNQKFMSQKEFYTYNIRLECEALVSLLEKENTGKQKFYLVCDMMGNTAIDDFEKLNEEKIAGTFKLDSIKEYVTTGYGCIEQTDPLLAWHFGLVRDSNQFMPTLMAKRTREQFEK